MTRFLVKLGAVLWLAGWLTFGATTSGLVPPWSSAWWPSCGPRFKVMEQTYASRQVFWLRRTEGVWPLCSSVLQLGAYDTLDDALAEARLRARVPDTDETEVGSVR